MKHYHYQFDRSRPLGNAELRVLLLDALQVRAIPSDAGEAAQLGQIETALYDLAGGDVVELHNLAQTLGERLLAEVPPGGSASFDFEQLCETVNNSADPLMVIVALLRNGVFPRMTDSGVQYSNAPLGCACSYQIAFDDLWWTGEEFRSLEQED